MQHPSTLTSPRWGLRRLLQAAAALGVVGFAAVMATTSSTGCGGGVFCDGGFIRKVPGSEQGSCEGKCTKAKCVADNTCVDNKCRLACESHLDCAQGTQDCTSAVEDDTEAKIAICEDNGKAPMGAKCPFGSECDAIFACPDGAACDPMVAGGPCPQADCKSLFCVTTGQGDADAFCTLRDCHADADCSGGYYCAPKRDPHAICNANPPKGNSASCGKTSEPCVDPGSFTANGATFVESQLCLLRNRCTPRGQCAPCATDLDCSGIPGQHCKKVGVENVCTRDCATDTDCLNDYKCDTGACVPRFGACTGTGKYCEPCRNDLDCGNKDSTSVCVGLSGGQRACFDIGNGVACAASTDCPKGPDGHNGQCINEEIGASPGDSGYGSCDPQYNTATNKSSCWCGIVGAECERPAECCSGTCKGGNFATGAIGKCL
jgi:hypothetical protein